MRCTQPQLLFELPNNFTEGSVGNFVQRLLATNPVHIERMAPGTFLVIFLNWTVAKRALELHGKKIRGINQTLKITEIQPKLRVEQVFDLLARKLENRERGDHYKGVGPGRDRERWKSPTRDSRYVRVTDAEKSPTRDSGDRSGQSPPRHKNGKDQKGKQA